MKRMVLPILLLTISSPAFAMWGWFKKKPAPTAVAPTTEATTISAEEPAKEQEEVKAELQEAPATVSGAESEAETTTGLKLPEATIKALSAGLGRLSNEAQFLNALKKGDINQIKTIVDNVDVNKPLKTSFAAPKAPLVVLFESDAPNKFEIAQLLIDKGADKTVLNKFAQSAIIDKDEKLVNWLTEQGIISPAQEVVEVEPAVKEEKAAEVIEPEEVIAEEVQTVVNPISNYPLRIKQLVPAAEEVIVVEAPNYTVTLEGEKIEAVEPVKAAQPAARPLSKAPTIFGELESEEFIEPAAVTKVARPLPAVPVAKPARQPRTRVWPSTPAPQPVEVKVEVTPKARRPLPATPVVAKPAAARPVLFEELETEAVVQPVAKPAARALPTPPAAVKTVTPVARPLPALPK